MIRLAWFVRFTMATSTMNGSGAQRANAVAGCNWKLYNPTPWRWFDTSRFSAPAQFIFGLDFSLFKNITLTDGVRAQLRQRASSQIQLAWKLAF